MIKKRGRRGTDCFYSAENKLLLLVVFELRQERCLVRCVALVCHLEQCEEHILFVSAWKRSLNDVKPLCSVLLLPALVKPTKTTVLS